MSIVKSIKEHFEDEHNQVAIAKEEQKVRVSIERRVENMNKLIWEHVPASERRSRCLAKLTEFRNSAERMLDDLDIPF